MDNNANPMRNCVMVHCEIKYKEKITLKPGINDPPFNETFGSGYLFLNENVDTLVARYVIAKKSTETDINKLRLPNIEAINAVPA